MVTVHWNSLWGWLMMVLSWVFIGWLVYKFFQLTNSGGNNTQKPNSPKKIAQKRYAAGEISSDEYRQIIDDLTKTDREETRKPD